MQPRMSIEETAIFVSFLRHSCGYVEFGAGGSTVVASASVKDWAIAIDSSTPWIDKVRAACAGARLSPEFLHVDIGQVGNWGVPIDPESKPRWETYHSAVWSQAKSAAADFYLIDGRFRVACFAQTVLHCAPDAVIAIHDFESRRHYHVVKDIGREIARAEDLSFFLPKSHERARAVALLERFKLEPA